MGVHRDPRNAEAVAKYHIGGLPADAGKSHQVLHTGGYFAAKALGQAAPSLIRVSVFARKKPVGLISSSNSARSAAAYAAASG